MHLEYGDVTQQFIHGFNLEYIGGRNSFIESVPIQNNVTMNEINCRSEAERTGRYIVQMIFKYS